MTRNEVTSTHRWAAGLLILVIGLRAGTAAAGEGIRFARSLTDEHTVAMWLFDEPHYPTMILTDAGPHFWDLRLNATAASLQPGKFGNALTLPAEGGLATMWSCGSQADRSRRLPFDHSPRQWVATLAGSDWTVEFWTRLAAVPRQSAVIAEFGHANDHPHTTLRLTAAGAAVVLAGELPGGEFHCPLDRRIVTDGEWHHLAFAYDRAQRRMIYWVDGQPQREVPPKGSLAPADLSATPGLIRVDDGNVFLAQPRAVTIDAQIDLAGGGPEGKTSKLWTGLVKAPWTGAVTFSLKTDDAARLTINGQALIARHGHDGPARGQIQLRQDEVYPIELKYYHPTDGAPFARLCWSWQGHPKELVPAEALCHVPAQRAMWEAVAAVDSASSQAGYVLSIGRDIAGNRPLHGQIDELRLSNVVRYRGAFTPQTHARNWCRPSSPKESDGPPPLFAEPAGIGPVQLGSRKHVFIDEALVEKKERVQLTLNPPCEQAPIDLAVDRPWETMLRFDTFYDYDGKVRGVYDNDGMWRSEEHIICLAESSDGIRFEKPVLNTTEWRGSTRNNILMVYPGQGSWLVDPNPQCPPEEKVKFTCFGMERGVHVFLSPDGVHVRRNETTALFSDVGGGVECFWDDQRGRYVTHLRHEGFLHQRGADGRAAFVVHARDILKPWPLNRILNPLPDKISEEFPIPFQPSRIGEVYRTRAIKYPWAPDVYLAFLWRMVGDHAVMQTELATSRDGVRWHFWGDQPIYFGHPDKSQGKALACYGLIRRGDEIWQYALTGVTRKNWTVVRLTQRLDGFVSLDAGASGGSVTTRAFVFEGDRLALNVAARGHVRVAILNPDGTEVPGFGLADCEPIQADSTRALVRWNGSRDVSMLQGYNVKLLFELQDAKLYAFQFQSAGRPQSETGR